jgi:outer membrane biogenesis lipoprotein LolB
MKKSPLLLAVVFCLLAACFSPASAQSRRGDDDEIKVEFNERQLEKHLAQYGEQLDLSRRQGRKIARIEKKYTKKENKLAEEKGLKLGRKRALQKEKAEALLSVLTDEQIERLNQLAGRKGLFRRII